MSNVAAALGRSGGVFMPSASQDPDGAVAVSLGAKGVVELELVASGGAWGRGPGKDVHSSNRARLDSPAFHLVQALVTLVTPDGDPAIEGFADAARPASAAQRAMLDVAASRLREATAKNLLSAQRWAHDLPWRATLERFLFAPTVNIEGLVAGYTGPGGKTVLPHRAVAKLDLRLVPDMTYAGAVAALKAHLRKRGFGDIEVNPSGGYDPTSTPARIQATSSPVIRCGFRPATSASATAAARTLPTSTSSSNRRTRRWPGGTPLSVPTSSTSTSSPAPGERALSAGH
jgi:acetylornithine deacetylase/succinyl-diaminopimelate desuccinylase-like protein